MVACSQREDGAPVDVPVVSAEPGTSDSESMVLTDEGRDRTGVQEPLPTVEPRDDAFERKRPTDAPLFPDDFWIGPVGPPVAPLDREVWIVAHSLLSDPETAVVSVPEFDQQVLDLVTSAEGELSFRVTPPVALGTGEYSLLFRRLGETPLKGELILVVREGEWYTEGIQWEAIGDSRAPFAPPGTLP